MCEQTEINYLDGDIVWVKLGACWWPGQVTSLHNLPEDIQIEFQKKPLIAAVKFFQEDTYEFVKNLHQIYKYNCTQKDDFIKKGLDKHRTKSKDGMSYMDKFPGDVEMAEKLTGGDPDILTSEKFCLEAKPDISALFGEKKIPKRKREREEMSRRSDSGGVARKITHPRFLKESDHEIRIRQQPSSVLNTPKTPSSDSPQFSCHLCNFTSTRVNVIICHRKSHCSEGGLESPLGRPRILSHGQPKSTGKASVPDTQKRKYVRKTKSLSNKGKTDRESEPLKRKLVKPIEKSTMKKKKTDPELREKLLADWDDESDEDMDLDRNKSTDLSSIESPSIKNSSKGVNSLKSSQNKEDTGDDGTEIIKASEKFLRETEKFTSLLVGGDDSSSRASRHSNNKHLEDFDSEADTRTSILTKEEKSPAYKKPKKLIASIEERKSMSSEKNDNQSRFSCFDFDEEDLPEPPITPVRKIPRIFGEKNTSVKKEILKKFTMSQALKNDKGEDRDSDEKTSTTKDFFDYKEPKAKEKGDAEQIPSPEKGSSADFPLVKEQRECNDKNAEDVLTIDKEREKSPLANSSITELEIVEIFEVEGEKDEREDKDELTKKSIKYDVQLDSINSVDEESEGHDKTVQIERMPIPKDTGSEIKGKKRRDSKTRISRFEKELDESMSEIPTTETEDENVSEVADFFRGNSDNSDTDGNLNQVLYGVPSTVKVKRALDDRGTTQKPAPRRRGRPRKSLPVVDPSGNGNDSVKHDIISKQVSTLVAQDSDRKTSESDSERPYSGRRRKPNKRYLHTEVYSSSPENRVSRTDESQSETDEKSQNQKKGRARRGKKKSSANVAKTQVEATEKTKDQEFEFSNRTLDTTDRVLPTDVTNVTQMDKEFQQADKSTLHEKKCYTIETAGESSTSCIFDFGKKIDSGVGSPVNITKLLSSGDSETGGSHKSLEDQEGNDEEAKQSENRNLQNFGTAKGIQISVDEAKSAKFDTTKTNVDKLPPKKSQIKKFELSQIDLLDACAEQVAAEQAAAEKLVEEKRLAEKLVAEKIAAEKLAAAKKAEEKLAAEKKIAEKLAADELAAKQFAKEKMAAEKLAAEELAAEKIILEKLAAEKLAAEKLAAEKIAANKLAAEKLVAEKLAAEKLAVEKLAAEKLAAETLAAEKLIAEKLTAETLAAEKLIAEKEAAEKLVVEKEAAEKLAAEKEAAEKLAAEKEAAEKLAAEKEAAEKLAVEKEAAEKLAAEKEAAEKLTAEKEATEKLAAEKEVAENLAAEKEAAEQLAEEKLAAEKETANKLAAEELAVEQAAVEKLPSEEEAITCADKLIEKQQKIGKDLMRNQSDRPVEKGDDTNKTNMVDMPSEQIGEVSIQTVPTVQDKNDSVLSMPVPDNAIESPVTDSTMEAIEAVLARITSEEPIEKKTISADAKSAGGSKTKDPSSKIDSTFTKDSVQAPENIGESLQSPMQNKYKGKSVLEISSKVKKDRDSPDEEVPINSFQEAFLKTLHIDKKDEKESETTDASSNQVKKVAPPSVGNVRPEQTIVIAIASGNNETFLPVSNIQDNQNVQPLNAMTEFEGVEILVQENIVEVDKKMDEENTTSQTDLAATLVGSDVKHGGISTLSLDLQTIQDTLSDAVSTPSPNSDVNVPVKKREKPRIIENVALKEPMQILKSKLMEKVPTKTTKHKLESEIQKKGESKGPPRAKMMKFDSPPGNSKARSPAKTTGSQYTVARKLQALKAEEAATAAAIEQDKAASQSQISQALTMSTRGEKFIQQSSQSLADMELDINSLPFVLSEDVLTPESIENMPVVISSILPSSSTIIPTSLALTSTTQLVTPNTEVMQLSDTNETVTTETTSSTKKKSGTPAILKCKGKGKPTITSIKTLVPPFAGGVKGLKFQSQQATGKVMPMMQQKSATPGKYVIVQTASGQQMRYSVQNKPGTQQKIAIPAGKNTGSGQLVQQGKVVILTSAQSGQTKMLPLNISKSMSGKVQKIVNNKGQIYTPMSPQGIMGSKNIIVPKTDASSPTTSKLNQGQKMINTQSIVTSKGVLTPISTAKSSLLTTLSQGILTKGGIYTPMTSAQLAAKTMIGGKNLVSKGTTILSPLSSQTLGTSKGPLLAPLTHTLTSKTILNPQGLVAPKGTVLTPITGQQVKAIAAKSPAKCGSKVHYQSLQQKLQLPILQKCQKVPVSTSSPMRAGGAVISPGSGGTIVLQNTIVGSPKSAATGGKKIVKQTSHQLASIRSPQATIPLTTNASLQQALPRGKLVPTTPTVQRVATPRSTGRQSKTQQKTVVQKNQESPIVSSGSSPIINIQGKPTINTNVAKASTTTHKQTSRFGKSNRNTQKHLINVASPSSLGTAGIGTIETSIEITPSTQSTLPLAIQSTLPTVPSLITPDTELPISETEGIAKIEKTADALANDNLKQETIKTAEDVTIEPPKGEETKLPAQPQIMALPTESSDGTQTYVLVTIDEQGQIQPLDNNTLMSLEGTTQNADGTRTLYIDPSSLGEAGTLDNIVLQFDNGALSNSQSTVGETSQSIVATDSFPSSEIIHTSNQDILAAALANTDFQQEIGLPENTPSSVMATGLTQTSLINQTILQSTIIPPTEPISSPSVLETSLTLNQPIMTPLEVPTSMPIQVEAAPPSVVSTIPTSLESPITITDSNISYISTASAVAAAAAATAAAAAIVDEGQQKIPGNSMPDIGEIMESTASGEIVSTDMSATTRYLVLPVMEENMTIESHDIETGTDAESASVTYSVSIPENIIIDNSQSQTTPSMPIIDDGYVESTEQRFAEVTVVEMPVSKTSSLSSPEIITSEVIDAAAATHEPNTEVPIGSQKSTEMADNSASTFSQIDSYTAHNAPVTEQMIVKQQESIDMKENVTNEQQIPLNEKTEDATSEIMQIDEQSTEVITTCAPIIEESCGVYSEMHVETESTKNIVDESTNLLNVQTENTSYKVLNVNNEQGLDSHACTSHKTSSFNQEQNDKSNLNSPSENTNDQIPLESVNLVCESMIVEEAVEMEIYPSENPENPDAGNSVGVSSQSETIEQAASENVEMGTESSITETSQEEAPSQSYEQIDASGVTSDSIEIPTQSVGKSENSQEASQSVAYESMEIDENTVTGEPPTQSFEDTKRNEASQSYERTIEVNTNAPTQSFNEIMQCQEEDGTSGADAIDDQSFPTQSYEVGKIENLSENLESDAVAVGQEGNIPSQSNDIGNDGIGTSSVSTNNSGLNEDETASSSYVPETPENQERDQDQESAISTSSYEIPPCEELNIASSSVIPDTSVRGEHMSIHDNGVPEIPTSSYNLNPDSSSTSHVDALPTSSYEDQVIIEQNVSTSYEVPISMPGVEENSLQNFVTESTDHRSEPTSYYARHPEVTASYYDTVNQDSNSRLEADPQEEVTPSYYEQPQDITSEASQSYFRQTRRYSSQSVSPSYYDPTPETEASQSSYYAHEIERTEQSSRNVEASQSFYQETTDEMRLRQQGEATPTYTERYPVDYALANSPIERHDLVESSVSATRPTER